MSFAAANIDGTPEVPKAEEHDILCTDIRKVSRSLRWMNEFTKCVCLTLKTTVYALLRNLDFFLTTKVSLTPGSENTHTVWVILKDTNKQPHPDMYNVSPITFRPS